MEAFVYAPQCVASVDRKPTANRDSGSVDSGKVHGQSLECCPAGDQDSVNYVGRWAITLRNALSCRRAKTRKRWRSIAISWEPRGRESNGRPGRFLPNDRVTAQAIRASSPAASAGWDVISSNELSPEERTLIQKRRRRKQRQQPNNRRPKLSRGPSLCTPASPTPGRRKLRST